MIKENSAMNAFQKAGVVLGITAMTFVPASLQSKFMNVSTVEDAMAQDQVAALSEGSASKVSHQPNGNLSIPESIKKYSVKTKDKSHYTYDEVTGYAAKVSPRAIIVLYNGTNEDWQRGVQAGASNAKDGINGGPGVYVRGMVIGKPNPNFKSGADSYMVYVDGLPVTEPLDASDPNVQETVSEIIFNADKEFLRTKLLSSNIPTRDNN